MTATIVNYETGEVTDAPVPVSQIENLPAEVREQAVTAYLSNARDRLAQALEATGPAAVASIKAEVATIAEMTKQLGLSRECRDDATEMVRRAEYALGKAIRKGQEGGTVAKGRADNRRRGEQADKNSLIPSVEDIEPNFYNNGMEIGHMAESTEEEFEGALTVARSEGNLSRANVVRKIKGQQSGQTRDQRANDIERMASQGHTSRQIASRMGMHVDSIKNIARDYGIDIPADRVTARRHRLNSDRILSGVAESVESAAFSLQQVNPLDLDQEAAQEWVDSLTDSISALRKALKPIKESLHG